MVTAIATAPSEAALIYQLLDAIDALGPCYTGTVLWSTQFPGGEAAFRAWASVRGYAVESVDVSVVIVTPSYRTLATFRTDEMPGAVLA